MDEESWEDASFPSNDRSMFMLFESSDIVEHWVKLIDLLTFETAVKGSHVFLLFGLGMVSK